MRDLPVPRSAALVVRRTKRLFPDALAPHVFTIDGSNVALLRRAQRERIALTPGRHTARASIGGSGSPTVHFEVSAVQTIYLTVASAVGPVTGLRTVLSGDEYLVLDIRSTDDLAAY